MKKKEIWFSEDRILILLKQERYTCSVLYMEK